MFKNYILIVSAAVLAVCSCGRRAEVRECLADVESYIQERPDSALAVLESLDSASLRGKRLCAEYSLLYAMALDKNYIDTADVNVALPAVRYFDSRGPAEKSMKAWFYLGREQENGGDYEDAIVSYTMAKELAKDSGDLRFRALISSGIADLYGKTYNNVEQIANMAESYDLATQSGDRLGQWIALGELAEAYTDMEQWDKADSLFNVFFSDIVDSSFVSYYLPCYASIFLLSPDLAPEKTLDLLDWGINELNMDLSPYYCGMYAYAFTLLGEHEKSEELLQFIDDDIACDWKYHIYKESGNYRQALGELENVLLEYEELLDEVFSQSVSRAQRDYFEAKTEKLQRDRDYQRATKIIIGLVSTLFVVLSAFVIANLIRHFHRANDEMAAIKVESESLRKERDRIIENLRHAYIQTYRSQFALIDELCSSYWSPGRNNDMRIYNKVKDLVSVIKDDTGRHSELEAKINSGFDDVMQKLRVDFPEFKENDFRLLAYLIVGFEAKTIAMMMDISAGSVYTRKSRLKEKILSKQTGNTELYKLCLG